MKIPIKSKKNLTNKDCIVLVLAWNFFEDIKKNNEDLNCKFLNIKDLEKNKFTFK